MNSTEIKIALSCSVKLHAFSLAEQLQRHNALESFFTTYASTVNKVWSKAVRRVDKEHISPQRIKTLPILAFPIKLLHSKVFYWNNLFDIWVSSQLEKGNFDVFIGWSCMSLHSIRKAKQRGISTVLERGSTHILYQNNLLIEENAKFGLNFQIDSKVIDKELQEYDEVDYISVPSNFVKKTFLEKGIADEKIFVNPYGFSRHFSETDNSSIEKRKFTIVYLGRLSIRKGLFYLFEALDNLAIPECDFDVLFIGAIDSKIRELASRFAKSNWKFLGHVDHYELAKHLSSCDIAVQPSLEEGLSMVILQLMACGVPVIATPNSGAENVIASGSNGFIIPARSSEHIRSKLDYLFNNREVLLKVKENASISVHKGFTWNDYGDRYWEFLRKICLH